MIDSPNSVQTVQKEVVIDGTVTANKDLTAQKGINLTSGTAKALSLIHISHGIKTEI